MDTKTASQENRSRIRESNEVHPRPHLYIVCAIKITQIFRRLGIPLTVIFLLVALEPAHYNGRGPSP